jgi:hypothetical protein
VKEFETATEIFENTAFERFLCLALAVVADPVRSGEQKA